MRRWHGLAATLVGLLLLLASPAAGQQVFSPVDELGFDDPEAWAMKYFTSAGLLTSLGPVEPPEAGGLDLGLELISIPHLDREERTVGFGGFKEEDLNRSPVWARLRASVGLPGGWGLTLGWTPPVEVDGVEADLVSLAVERSLWSGDAWSLGARLYGQTGDATGDFTCAEGGDLRFPPGSQRNPFGCQAPSDDEITMDYAGIELVGSWDLGLGRSGRASALPVLHAGVAWNHLDMEFQVDARTFGFLDRTLLLADGETVSYTVGATWDLGRPGRLSAELFYSPLDVLRRGEPAKENDGLFDLRLAWRIAAR